MGYFAGMHPEARRLTYLDSDLFYFSDPKSLEREYADAAITLTPTYTPPRRKQHCYCWAMKIRRATIDWTARPDAIFAGA